MKITIFGASSASGQLLVEKALAAGHHVTAFVRDADKLDASHDRLTVVKGDALLPQTVEAAVQEAEAVLNVIGPIGTPTAITAETTQNIVDAMKKSGTKRIVVISVGGITVPEDQRTGFDKILSSLLKFLLNEMFQDREKQLEVLMDSGLEWVAVRVPRLVNGAASGKVFAGFFGEDGASTSLTRADLADFMLAQLTDDTWLGKAPLVTNKK